MAKTVSMGSVSLADLNDIVASATAPTKPTTGVLWLDTTTNILKRWTGSAWVNQQMELKNLDPTLATVIENAVASLGTMANDNLLNLAERQQLKDDLSNIVGKVMANTEKVMPTIAQLELDKKGSLYSARQNALNAGLKSTDASYIKVATEYQNLKTYLESLGAIGEKVFPWDTSAGNSTKNIAVVKDTFRDKWLQYYLAIETLNLATTQKIKENQEELDGKIDEVSLRDKTSILSGNPVYTDKADDAVVHVEVDGKSEQEGKNTLKYSGIFNSYAPYNTTPTISGSTLSTTYVGSIRYITIGGGGFVPGTRYLIKGIAKINGVPVVRESWNANRINSNNPPAEKFTVNNATGEFESIETYGNHSNSWLMHTGILALKPNDVFTIDNLETIPLEPSPSVPIAIKSLDKSFDIVSSVGKSNLLPNSNKIVTSPNNTGLGTAALMGDESTPYYRIIATNTISTYETPIWNWMMANAIVGKQYTLSVDVRTPTGGAVNFMGGTTTSATGDIKQNVWTRVYLTFNYVSGKRYGGLVHSDKQLDYRNWKLEEGSFSPYSIIESEIQPNTPSPTSYKTNILLNEPLRSVGDVKDRLFLDTDGLWKVERNVGEYKITGDEGYTVQARTNTLLFNSTTGVGAKGLGSDSMALLSTHFKPNIIYAKDEEGVYFNPTGLFRISINKSKLTANTVVALKTWLTANDVRIQYQLETPTIETLSAEQQTKLNNIQSFKGSNYVYTVDGSGSGVGIVPELNGVFKSNTWYRVNVLGEQLVYGHRNWAVNGNFGYPLEDKDWKNYYKGTTRTIVDISSEDPPFKNALRINQTASAVAGIIDAVIWDGAVANDLVGKSVSMATWLKYQNITSGITMQIQVTGQKADGTFVNDYYKMFSYTGTDVTWKRQTGTAKIKMPDGANKVTRVLFKLGFTEAGTGEFWATGIQIETGTALGDWIPNPDDVQGDLEKTKAQLILTEKEIGFKVTKGEVIEEINLQPGQATIKAEKINIKGAVTFESFNPQVKSDFDAKATKTEAQGYANAVKTVADKAQQDATSAQGSATTANNLLTDLANDNKLTASEKKEAKKEWDIIVGEKPKIEAEATKYAIGTEKTTFVTRYNTLNSYISPLLTNLNATSDIVGTTFRTHFKNYYDARQDLLNAITSKAKQLADDANELANSASNLAGTKAKTFTTTPTTPYASGDVWRNGSAVYISTATRTSGAYVVADWVLVGDVTSNNTAKDTASVGGTASTTIKTQASNGALAYNSTSLWQTTGRTTIDGGKVTADSITSGAIKSDVALINKLFVSDANVNVLTSKTAFINSVKSVDISADRIKTGTLSSITIDSPFNYVYEGAIRNSGNTRMANGEITMNGVFTNSYGNTFLKINPDTIYAENMQSNGSVRSMFKLSGKGLEVNILGKSAKYTQDGIYFESGGNASVKYNSGDARIEISSYNGVALGVNSSGSFYYRISAGGGQDGLAPFVDIWTDLNLRSNLNVRGNTVKNASTVSGVENLLFADTSNRIVQGSDNVLNIMSPSQIDMGYTNGTNTSKSLTVSNEGTVFFKKVNFSNNSVNGLNNLNNLKTMLFDGSSNRIVQAGDGSMNILAPIQLNLGWTNGSSTFTTMIVTQHQIVAKKTLNMDGNNISNQSDRRLKKNIIKTERNVVDSIKKWNFVEYYWKSSDKPSGNQFGLIAQDTPELMIFEEEDDYYGIDSSRQIMLNSRGVQELAFKNDKQDLRVDGLEEKIKELETIIQEMRK